VSDLTCIGAIAGSFGVRGEVRLKSFCAQPEAIAAYSPVQLEDGRSVEIRLGATLKNGFAARLTGIDTKEQADALKGARLYVPRDRLPAPEEDEYYYVDLVGIEVVDTGGTAIGTVRGVIEQGPGDLLEITVKGQSETVLVPFTRAIVPTVDLTARRIVIDPPEGLLDG